MSNFVFFWSFWFNFDVWVPDFQGFDIKFGFSMPRSPRGQILGWFYSRGNRETGFLEAIPYFNILIGKIRRLMEEFSPTFVKINGSGDLVMTKATKWLMTKEATTINILSMGYFEEQSRTFPGISRETLGKCSKYLGTIWKFRICSDLCGFACCPGR